MLFDQHGKNYGHSQLPVTNPLSLERQLLFDRSRIVFHTLKSRALHVEIKKNMWADIVGVMAIERKRAMLLTRYLFFAMIHKIFVCNVIFDNVITISCKDFFTR